MADAPNAPEETNLIPTGGGRRRNTRPRRGEGLGVTRIRSALPEEANIPTHCPVCDGTYATAAGLAVHRSRNTACNSNYRRRVRTNKQRLFLVTYNLLYAIEITARWISYAMGAVYFASNCSPIKFHSRLTVFVVAALKIYGLRPFYVFLKYINRTILWATESYHNFPGI